MELHSGKSVIVEFNGLPGTGKTTTAIKLKQLLFDNEIDCIDSFYYGKSFKRSRYANWISPSCWRLSNLLNDYITTFAPSVGKYSRNSKFLQFFREYCEFNSLGCGVLLKDQGLVQMLLSIAHLDKISQFGQIEKIASFLDKRVSFIRVDCLVDADISYQRILKRPRLGSRLEDIDSIKLMEVMKLQADNLEIIRTSFDEQIRKNIHVIKIDTKESADNNAKFVYKQMQLLLS